MLLDEHLPRWQFRERHSRGLVAPLDEVLRAVEDLTWAEVPVFRALMRVRALRGADLDRDTRVLDGMTGAGFAVLARGPDELVFGLERGAVSIAANFRYDGSRLTTETRVAVSGRSALRRFRLYWLAIRGPSGLIRHEWLRAIAARVARSSAI